MTRPLKILYVSVAPTNRTGYGTQSINIVRALKQLGHEVVWASMYGLQGSPIMWEDTLLMPMYRDFALNDILPDHVKRHKPDIVMTLFDCHVYRPQTVMGMRWCPLAPIDHVDVPQMLLPPLRAAWQPMAYSMHGFEAMKRAGLDPLYIPHMIDDKVFRILPEEETAKSRQNLALPEDTDFVAIMVAGNNDWPARKGFSEVFDAWKIFKETHPKAFLYLHTNIKPQPGMEGMQLDTMLQVRGLMEDKRVGFPEQYDLQMGLFTDAAMCGLYNAADVLLNPSWGEGFGLPIVESQMCGCPVIVNNTTSMPELCFSGWITETSQPIETAQIGYRQPPKIEGIVESLNLAYTQREYNRGEGETARHAALEYSCDNVREKYWKPALEKIAERIDMGGEVRMVRP